MVEGAGFTSVALCVPQISLTTRKSRFMELTNEMRAAVYRELVSDDFDINNAMLGAASKIPLERENGGIEYPAIKAFRAMISAAAKVHGINV